MATYKGKLKTKTASGTDVLYPETSADMVVGLGAQVIVLEENGSTTAGTWLAKTDRISSLAEGQLFLYKVKVAGASTTTLNITANGTALGAKTIYRSGTAKLTTHYPVGSYIMLYYNGTAFTVVNDYDANSDAYVRQYQASASTTGKYPLLARYNTTDKSGTYDTAYSRYHTDVTLDTSNGTLDAPAITVNGNAVLTSHQSLSNCAKLNSQNSFTASNYFYSGSKAAFYQGSTVLNSAKSALLGYDSLIFKDFSLYTSYKAGKIVVEDSSNQYELTLPSKSGEIALKSDISGAVMYEHNVSVYFDGNLSTTGGTFRNVIYMQFKFVDTQATISSWSALVSRMLSVWPDNTSVRFPCNGWLIYNNNSFNCIINNMAREGDHIFINARAANGTTGEIYAYFYGNETVNYYDSVTTIAVPAVMTNYAPTTVWSGSVTQSGGSRTLSSLSGASTLDDGIWRITVTYQGATIGITLLIADGKGYGYGGESSMGSYNVYMVGLQYESGTFWARGTTFKGSSNNYGSGSVSDVAFQATITYKKIERLVSF